MTDVVREGSAAPVQDAQVPGSGRGSGDDLAVPSVTIRVFENVRLLALVAAVPVLTALVLVVYRFFPGDPMLASGLGAVVIGFIVFLLFAMRVPDAFAMVRLRGLVPETSMTEYAEFEREVEQRLNSRWSVVLAIAGAAIGFARYPTAMGGLDPLLGQGPTGLRAWGPIALGDMLGETLIGAAAGLAIWRMVIVGVEVYRLGRFPLRIQLGHPDRCGGFEPLGNLCLWNALILSVPGVFLGWWIIAGPTSQYGDVYVALHSALASVVVVLATIAFLAPLWGIHQAMVRSAVTVRDVIERHGQRIDQLARELVAARDDLAADAWDAKSKDLERRKALYLANEKVPTWPIDVRLATKFGTSQLVPLLGVTGLSEPIVNAIKALTSFLDGAGGSG